MCDLSFRINITNRRIMLRETHLFSPNPTEWSCSILVYRRWQYKSSTMILLLDKPNKPVGWMHCLFSTTLLSLLAFQHNFHRWSNQSPNQTSIWTRPMIRLIVRLFVRRTSSKMRTRVVLAIAIIVVNGSFISFVRFGFPSYPTTKSSSLSFQINHDGCQWTSWPGQSSLQRRTISTSYRSLHRRLECSSRSSGIWHDQDQSDQVLQQSGSMLHQSQSIRRCNWRRHTR